MKRVGIFAGTFDPVHDGHVSIAQHAITNCGLDKVYFLVEPRPRWKQGVKAYRHRVAMVRLAIAQDPRLGIIELEQERFSVTETLPTLKNMFRGAELSMLLGEDVITHLIHWPHIEQLAEGVSFVIGLRQHTEAEVKKNIAEIGRIRGLRFRYKIFATESQAVSSSHIRKTLHDGHISSGVSPAVLMYIKKHKLYTSAAAE